MKEPQVRSLVSHDFSHDPQSTAKSDLWPLLGITQKQSKANIKQQNTKKLISQYVRKFIGLLKMKSKTEKEHDYGVGVVDKILMTEEKK